MKELEKLQDIIIVVGHYGSGKTNYAINLAIDLAHMGRKVSLADLDIVNPYFRSADFAPLAENHNVQMILPPYANSNLDMPIVSGAIDAAIEQEHTLILDIGGDNAGAMALGRYAPRIMEKEYSLLFVCNEFRPMTDTAEKTHEMLAEIEAASRLKCDYIVNNSNLGTHTTLSEVESGMAYSKSVEKATKIPLLHTVVSRDLVEKMENTPGKYPVDIYPVDIYVKTPWM